MSGSSQRPSVAHALRLAVACLALAGLGFVSGVDFAQRHRDPISAGDFGERGDWFISFQQPVSGRVTYPSGDGEPIRVQLDRADAAASWRAQLMFPAPSLVRGTTYRVTFQARADRPRRVGLRMMEDHPSFQAVGLVAEMQVETDWRPYEWTFVSTTTDDRVNVVFNVGESTIPLEISHLAVQPQSAVQPHNAAAAVETPAAEAAKKSPYSGSSVAVANRCCNAPDSLGGRTETPKVAGRQPMPIMSAGIARHDCFGRPAAAGDHGAGRSSAWGPNESGAHGRHSQPLKTRKNQKTDGGP